MTMQNRQKTNAKKKVVVILRKLAKTEIYTLEYYINNTYSFIIY